MNSTVKELACVTFQDNDNHPRPTHYKNTMAE